MDASSALCLMTWWDGMRTEMTLTRFMLLIVHRNTEWLCNFHSLQMCGILFLILVYFPHLSRGKIAFSLWDCWVGIRQSIWPVESVEVLACYLSRLVCIFFAHGLASSQELRMNSNPVISYLIKIQNGFAFLVLAYLVVVEKGPLNVCLIAKMELIVS